MRDIDGHISHELHAARAAGLLECGELAEEDVLLHADLRDDVRVRDAKAGQCLRVAIGERGRPLCPRDARIGLLERHEQREVVQPCAVLVHELLVACIRHEARMDVPQHAPLVRNRFGEVHLVRGQRAGRARDVDEERVAGERGEALIRRVAVARGAQWQHLPEREPRVGEHIEEA